MKKSCCNNCKTGKPCCGPDMGPRRRRMRSHFAGRRSIGYGVYGSNDIVVTETGPAQVAPLPAPETKKIFGLDPQLAYLIGGLLLVKILL